MSASKLVTHCPICHQPLDNLADIAMGVCAKPLCRGPYFRQRNLASEATRRAWREDMAKETLENWNALMKKTAHPALVPFEVAEVVVIVVPVCVREVTLLPHDRKAKFIEHLKAVLVEADEIIATQQKIENLRTEFAHRQGIKIAPSPSIVVNGCSTCRGYCCQHGGTTAFLTAGFLAWQMQVDDQVTVDSLFQQYIEWLPSETVEGSCVYHSSLGCSLPRDLRNEICNNFHCEGLMDSFDSFDKEPSTYSIAIATDGERPQRIGIVQQDGLRREVDLRSN